MKTLYIMLTKNQTVFCKLITSYTKQPFAHVSLLFDSSFVEGYSFARKNIDNPFIGGFKKENYPLWVAKFPSTYCRIYTLEVEDSVYTNLLDHIHTLQLNKEDYTYNIAGVVGRCFKLRIKPKNSYFCSQFVSYMLITHGALAFDKDPICITAGDFMTHPALNFVYEGYLNKLIASPSLITSSLLENIS